MVAVGTVSRRPAVSSERVQLVLATREELSHLYLASDVIEKNVQVADKVFVAIKPVETPSNEKGPSDKRRQVRMAEIPYGSPLVATPSVLHPGNAVARQTGSWRVERPVIDKDICTRDVYWAAARQ